MTGIGDLTINEIFSGRLGSEKVFKCAFCPERFDSMESLFAHQKENHYPLTVKQ